jgi:predicted lipid-binding transport protein (Tim44 family)
MKHFWMIVVTVALALGSQHASAKRMGGFSFGKQSSKVTQRQATPPSAPAAPTQAGAAGAAGAAGKAAGGSRFGGMLGGLAAGLGLAWLASSLGFGEGFGNVLLIALLAMAGVYVFRMLARPRMAPAGAGGGAAAPGMFKAYDSKNVGNDASARPWESGAAQDGASLIGSSLLGNQMWGVPEGFDTVGFLNACKRNFTTLQAAWDASDVVSLRAMMTDEMVANIQEQLNERDSHSNGEPNVTEVLKLDAQLLGIEEIEGYYMASVEFNGLIRESAHTGPTPFREVWNVTRPITGPGGWLVAGVQALG